MTTTITKQSTDYSQVVLNRVKKDPLHGIPALEIALLELALYDLWSNRDEIIMGARAQSSPVGKFHRAMIKSYLGLKDQSPGTQLIAKKYISKQGGSYVTIPEYERKNGVIVQEHRRRLPDGHSARDRERTKEITDEIREASEYQRGKETTKEERETLQDAARKTLDVMREQTERDLEDEHRERKKTERLRQGMEGAENAALDFDDIVFGDDDLDFKGPIEELLYSADSIAESVTRTADSDITRGAVKSFLEKSSIGAGIMAVADFFGHKANTFRFAAKAISEYGPMVGIRMAHAYHRYGGYDMPVTLNPNGEGYITEHGDVLPPISSQEETRAWAIRTLADRLPPNEADQGNAEPPSEGFIIDRNGEIIAHGTGRGNDHFLPFSMRHLRKMRKERGVEYVRRRMFGGPTTEDLHVAMMMGADKLTIVSNGGTYSIDLSARSHGLKVEHSQVLGRFHDLMDRRKNRRFQDYDEVLRALEAEFPLHFRVSQSTPGPWRDRDDRIGPKDSFLDQMRKLFGVPTQRDRLAQSQRDKVTADALRKPPWHGIPGGMDAYIAQERRKGRKRSDVLGDALDWGQQTNGLSNEHMRRLSREIEAALNAEQERGVSQTPNYGPRVAAQEQAADRARQVAAEPYGTVLTSRATPEDLQHTFSRGITALEQAGKDVGAITTKQLERAAPVLSQFDDMTDEEIEQATTSGFLDDIWEDIRDA